MSPPSSRGGTSVPACRHMPELVCTGIAVAFSAARSCHAASASEGWLADVIARLGRPDHFQMLWMWFTLGPACFLAS